MILDVREKREHGGRRAPDRDGMDFNSAWLYGHLTYTIETMEGEVPTEPGPVTLFIDPFGRPLSPVSVCGVRRRERRRERRLI